METAAQIGRLTHNVEDFLYTRKFFEKGLTFESGDGWRHHTKFKPSVFNRLGKVIHETYVVNGAIHKFMFESDDMLGTVNFNSRSISISVGSRDKESIRVLFETLRKEFPERKAVVNEQISVKFWNNTPGGPDYNERRIDAPEWKDILHNYTAGTREGLEQLLTKFTPDKGGQIILWHGEPGTGKTFALRALCQEWKSWCNIDYILDPEALFGYSPQYLTSLIFSSNSTYEEEAFDEDDFDDVDQEWLERQKKEAQKWKLLILEDTGELLSESAKERAGQGLSRLLNVADGFIGQGLKVMVLITTNEMIEKLHPAVARPGRCAAIIKFDHLDSNEVKEWCKINKISVPAKENPTVAELYSVVDSQKQIVSREKKKNGLGFKVLTTA